MKIVEQAGTIEPLEDGQFKITSDIPGLAVRFAVTDNTGGINNFESSLLLDRWPEKYTFPSLSGFKPRDLRMRPPGNDFNVVMIIPTGIGCEIGGHAGDANPVAMLLAQTCDNLILHPNVVNASDLNEMPSNSMYVEGSTIDRLLNGTIGLAPVRANRILVVIDQHEDPELVDKTINMVNAAQAHWGMNLAGITILNHPRLVMKTSYAESGRAVGEVENVEHLFQAMKNLEGVYDAVAISSVIQTPPNTTQNYYMAQGDIVNPWGGVESMLTHAVSLAFDVPVAHAPMLEKNEVLVTGQVDPRMAAEDVSITFLHSVLKGLHRSPRIVPIHKLETIHPQVLTAENVDAIVIPNGCLGLSVLAAKKQGIPVIAVRENTNLMKNDLTLLDWKPGMFYQVNTYMEAAGLLLTLKAGIDPAKLGS